MKTFPLQSLTIIEAQQKQFALVDSICRHFPGSEFLTGGDLGLTPGLNQPRVTQRVEQVLADAFHAQAAALVQGAEAAPSLIAGMRHFMETRDVDVIIIGRGGGSIEDLWAFNSEELARTIAACPIPVISAVGHETDFTICDFVADRRAPTPSAAAELAVPETHELMHKIDNIIGRMSLLLSRRLESGRQVLDFYMKQGVFAHPERLFEDRKMQLLLLGQRLETAENNKLVAARHALAERGAKLEALSPLSILSRGYSVATGADGRVLTMASQTAVGEDIALRLADGALHAKVTSLQSET